MCLLPFCTVHRERDEHRVIYTSCTFHQPIQCFQRRAVAMTTFLQAMFRARMNPLTFVEDWAKDQWPCANYRIQVAKWPSAAMMNAFLITSWGLFPAPWWFAWGPILRNLPIISDGPGKVSSSTRTSEVATRWSETGLELENVRPW